MKTVLITGATDGIGKVTAKKFIGAGFRTIIHGRNPQKIDHTINEFKEIYPTAAISGYKADFSDLAQVKALAEKLNQELSQVDVLVNNAGLGPGKKGKQNRQTSMQGYEIIFAVNYLAPFHLTNSSIPLLKRSKQGRIINVSSAAQNAIDFGDLMLENNYSGSTAYSQSKLALVAYTFSLAAILKDDNITVNALHPGSLLDTNMVREAFSQSWGKPDEGAEAIFYLATNESLADKSGWYFDQTKQAKANMQAYDAEFRQKLWDVSEKLLQNKS